jgi:CheY-like chemotaxis protein
VLDNIPFNLIQFLKNIKTTNTPRAREKNNSIKIICDETIPDYVTGDEIRLNQVLNNLVNNAIKFTTSGTITIKVVLEDKLENDLKLKFSVIDTGIGIAAEKQELIFDRFMQASGDARKDSAGAGLGLNIVKRILELQDAHIYVKSAPNKGSEFYFSIWLGAGTPAEMPVSDNNNPKNLQGLHVLLAEDMQFNVIIIEKILRNWNAHVEIVRNGKEAIEKVKSTLYDAILMDIQMPVMDGYDAATAIRKIQPGLPIIALTANTSKEVQEKIKNTGMNDFVSKPFNPQNLYKALNKYLPQKA